MNLGIVFLPKLTDILAIGQTSWNILRLQINNNVIKPYESNTEVDVYTGRHTIIYCNLVQDSVVGDV